MKVLVDQNIPFIRDAILRLTDDVEFLPAVAFTPQNVKHADALIIRTRTHCDATLLTGSQVKLIVTATIGYDHIDTQYCREAGITWINCPGCNARSVEQYIQSVLILLHQEGLINRNNCTLGIVGVGHVGSSILNLSHRMGLRVLLNDPILQSQGKSGFVSLDHLADEADIISFHTPLTTDGEYPTFHLANMFFFQRLRKQPVIINTSRGEVIDTKALHWALDNRKIRQAVIDVWEHEPHIDTELLKKVFIGTPHIAGYSADGKANATRMALEAFCHFYHLEPDFIISLPDLPDQDLPDNPDLKALSYYDPRRDATRLLESPDNFESLRSHYPLRREHWESQ